MNIELLPYSSNMIILVGMYLCANGEDKLFLIFLDSIDGKRNFLVFLALIPQTITE
jgi:hypothetical protein